MNLKKSDEFKNVIPSKIFENIAMYKPILLGVEGESKKIIDDYEVGVCFEPENKESFLNAIKDIQKLDRDSFKVNCNKMLTDFDRNNIAEDLIKFIIYSIASKRTWLFKIKVFRVFTPKIRKLCA